jgi:long-chain acyl-CoA synthetase
MSNPAFAPAAPIWDALSWAASAYADRVAVARGDEAWTYDRLFREADAVRRRLAVEVPEGPVLFVAHNTPASLAFLLGSVGSGAVPLLADPAWGAHELAGIVLRCAARAVAWDGEPPADLPFAAFESSLGPISLGRVTVPRADQAPVRPRADTAFGRFTSGTSGFARCLQFRARAALAAAAGWRQAARLSADDRVLCLATLNNGLAFNTSVLALLLAGGTLVFHPGRLLAGSLVRTLFAVRPAVLVAFPFAFEMLAGRVPADLGLRLAVSSAAPLAAGVRERWREEMGLAICDYYGLAEVGPCTFNDGSRPGSVGVPLAGVSFTVTDDDGREVPAGEVGRIRVRTPSMASDYLDTGDTTFASNLDGQGRYVTRDLGLVTPEGHLVLRGRVGRVVNVAGRKIDPTEVEATLKTMPGVSGAVVCGEEAGGRPVLTAYVESATVGRDDVVRHCLDRLAQYKVPQRIIILAELPRSSAGKVSLGRIVEANADCGVRIAE